MRFALLLLAAGLLAAPTFAQGLTAEENEAAGIESGPLHEVATPAPQTTMSFSVGGNVLLIPESTNDAVMVLDATTGDLINLAFVADGGVNLATPINAIADLDGSGIIVCDQLEDGAIKFTADGAFESFFAPAGGPDTAILDNVRGCATHNGALHVTTASGANADAIASFDATGAYTGNLIANLAGGMNGPFDVLFRSSDILVAAIDTDGIYRYDLTGTFLDLFATGQTFLEQLHETSTGNILAAEFSGTSGVYEYLPDGTLVSLYTWGGISGLRGVHELPSGNLLITTGAGVFEVQRNGTVVRQIVDSVSARFIEEVPASVIPVELGHFNARVDGSAVSLTWDTHSETNNAGFEVQMARGDASDFQALAFVAGHGTTTEAQDYSYRVDNLAPGTYFFRLKQIDFDGAAVVTGALEVEVGLPGTHLLSDAYPNPFNPSTTLRLTVATAQDVRVEVFDMTGRRVAVLFDGAMDAGATQTLAFDARGLTSGIYAVRVAGATFQETRSITLLK